MQKQISTIISLKDRFSQPLLKMSKNVDGLTQETRSSMNQVNRWGKQVERSVDRAVKAAARWAKRGAILATGFSVKQGIEGINELDSAVRKVKSIAGDRLGMDEIEQQLKDFSFQFGVEIPNAGDIMYESFSASVPEELISQVMELSHMMATAGFTTDEEALKLLATTANAFDLKTAEGYANLADQFLKTQELGLIQVGGMAQGYGVINSLSKSIGATTVEQNAAIATMTKMGMQEPEAITAYRSILNEFLKPISDTTAGHLSRLGLGEDFLTAKSFEKHGFGGAMKKVMEATKGDLDEIAKIFKNIRGKTGATIFTGEGMGEYERIFELISDPEDALKDAMEVMEGSIAYQWNIFKKRIKSLNTEFYQSGELGEGISSMLERANKWLEDNRDDIIKSMNDITDSIADMFVTIKDNKENIALALKFFTGLYMLTKGASAFATIVDNFETIGRVLGKMKIGDIVTRLGDGKILAAISKIGVALGGLALWEVAALLLVIVVTVGHFKDHTDELKESLEGLKTAIKFVVALVLKAIYAIGKLIEVVVKFFGNAVNAIWEFMDALKSGKGFIGAIKAAKEGFSEFKTEFDYPLESWLELDGLTDFKDLTEKTDDSFTGLRKGVNKQIDGKFKVSGLKEVTKDMDIALYKWKELGREMNKKPTYQGIGPVEYGNLPKVILPDLTQNYKGTPNWKGGLTRIHERGGEVMDVPGGTRIYPHDESVRMAYNDGLQFAGQGGKSVTVNLGGVNFTGDFNTETDINEIGTKIVDKIKRELNNI